MESSTGRSLQRYSNETLRSDGVQQCVVKWYHAQFGPARTLGSIPVTLIFSSYQTPNDSLDIVASD